METAGPPTYWIAKFLFERALALIYLGAFIGAANQFVPLLGERGLLPVARFTEAIPFRASPSLFYFWQSDTVFRVAAWIGIAISVALVMGLPQRIGAVGAGIAWFVLWVLYLSFVNVGQTFYGFGWESLLLENGFFAILLGGATTAPSMVLRIVWAWILFRLMFGAGLIKMRGDPCWRNLTCLDYYFETQPIPNPLSWYFHWMPAAVHRAGVAFNHFVELIVPWFYFVPQPYSSLAAVLTVVFQLVLVVSGNLSWLNWLTIVICIPLIEDRWLAWLPISPVVAGAPAVDPIYRAVVYVAAGLVAVLSIQPVINMLSPNQVMNTSFEPLHLVNTYGAFGSVTKTREEIVIEGTTDASVTAATVWHEYAFKGKPGAVSRRPIQIAPYHLRLDWLMWFEAMAPQPSSDWFSALIVHLLQGDRATLSLLAGDPLNGERPRFIRARYYRYTFTTPDEHRRTGQWWNRQVLGEFLPPVSLRSTRN